ncbi:MAG: FKBP-type peptidyl-prolyl cis-trans isomerase [Candidatus Aminicenantes bacterium]|jgi:FKBP-type peptidyl-prolyl cis-trans isomerase
MRRIIIVFVSVALLIVVNVSCTKSTESGSPDKKISLETLQQKGSYIMGYQQGRNLKMRQFDTEIDLDTFIQGLKDAIKGESQIEEKDMNEIFREFFQGVRERLEEKKKVLGEKNKAEGEQFLKENAEKEGVTVTESGLQYMVLKEGTGSTPAPTDIVTVHYQGTLIDGTEFDSSYKRGEPAKFPLNRVIKGWTEGLQLMNPGAKYKFFIPSDLGYGDRGQGDRIGPNAVLIFEVELLGFEPAKTPASPMPGKPEKPTPAKKEQDK